MCPSADCVTARPARARRPCGDGANRLAMEFEKWKAAAWTALREMHGTDPEFDAPAPSRLFASIADGEHSWTWWTSFAGM